MKQNASNKFLNKVVFAVGTGRCGTTFLYRLYALEANVASSHERNPLNETFHRYCKWYDLPVDHEGYLHEKEKEICTDLEEAAISFESSAYLSFSIKELYERFGAKFILMIRSPEKVVSSYLTKGWYKKNVITGNPELALGYQPHKQFHHFLGRTVPKGEELHEWQKMSRVGKLAWFWATLNLKVVELLSELPEEVYRIQKLEDLTYERYQDLASFSGFTTGLSQKQYNALVKERPNSFKKLRTTDHWTEREKEEFESQVKTAAQYFHYEYKIDNLIRPSPPKNPSILARLRERFFPE